MAGFIGVNALPVVYLGNDTSLCSWNTVLLDAGNPGGSYLWSTGATTQTIVADSALVGYGAQDYRVEVINHEGCSAQDTIKVTFDNCTGIPDTGGKPVISVFPNPSDGHFILDIRGFKGSSWQLLTITGTVVVQSEISLELSKATIDISDISKGVYILKVKHGFNIHYKKIVLR